MTKKKKEYLVGCSGYYYPNWKNEFYPAELSSSKWLEYYSSVFNTVELNGTFYRMPKPADLKRQAKNTPDEFKFSVKMNRYITHISKLKGMSQKISEFSDLIGEGLNGKVHKILLQMPPSFQFSEENLERISGSGLSALHVIEFRHASWWNKKTEQVLKKMKCTFCNVDFPGLETGFIHSSRDFYLRLHGNPELFKSSYSERELRAFGEKIPAAASKCAIYFNNTYYGAGWRNAISFKQIIGENLHEP